jgi:small subunit ribosomal protein S8
VAVRAAIIASSASAASVSVSSRLKARFPVFARQVGKTINKRVQKMSKTDPIADYLTRIRNAAKAKHRRVDIPSSNLKKAISKILLAKSFVAGFTVLEDKKQNILRINLKYHNGKPVITGLRRISKPGIRMYRGSNELPRVLGGLGVAIISTSKGVMTDAQAKKDNVGGEILAYIW